MSLHKDGRRWLFVDAIPHFGGHEVMLLRWLEQLLQGKDVEPRLLARAGSRLQQLAPQQTLSFEPFPPEIQSGRLRGLRNIWQELKTLRRALSLEKPECVVFASGALGYQMLMVTVARVLGARVLVYVPLLDTFEAMGYRGGRIKDLFVRWVYGRVPSGWVAISENHAEHFRRWARPTGPVFVLQNTVAPAIEAAPRLAPRPLNDGDRLRVLVLGRLDAKHKGLDWLLDYLDAAPAEVQAQLLVCMTGEGPFRATVEARLQVNPALASCLTLGDWMPAEQALAGNDVLLMTSRFEGVPLVMLEAMALGVPVVGSDLPGIRAYIPSQCLFAVGDIDSAVQILISLRSQARRQVLADEGRTSYEASASSAAFAKAVAQLVVDVRATFRISTTQVAKAVTMGTSKP
ncbi:glycosyltransferase family 4 protein [Variovorax sp. HJSM1_2]|uniref:glycosyltransferase family 4 protein n=1 Tax=Variovorax sp. HJSM1_2 TaxID=3366263 RepID=UPI003BE1F622